MSCLFLDFLHCCGQYGDIYFLIVLLPVDSFLIKTHTTTCFYFYLDSWFFTGSCYAWIDRHSNYHRFIVVMKCRFQSFVLKILLDLFLCKEYSLLLGPYSLNVLMPCKNCVPYILKSLSIKTQENKIATKIQIPFYKPETNHT